MEIATSQKNRKRDFFKLQLITETQNNVIVLKSIFILKEISECELIKEVPYISTLSTLTPQGSVASSKLD